MSQFISLQSQVSDFSARCFKSSICSVHLCSPIAPSSPSQHPSNGCRSILPIVRYDPDKIRWNFLMVNITASNVVINFVFRKKICFIMKLLLLVVTRSDLWIGMNLWIRPIGSNLYAHPPTAAQRRNVHILCIQYTRYLWTLIFWDYRIISRIILTQIRFVYG